MQICADDVCRNQQHIAVKHVKKTEQLNECKGYGTTCQNYKNTRAENSAPSLLPLARVKHKAEKSVTNANSRNGYEQVCRLRENIGNAVLLRGKNACVKRHKQEDKHLG